MKAQRTNTERLEAIKKECRMMLDEMPADKVELMREIMLRFWDGNKVAK